MMWMKTAVLKWFIMSVDETDVVECIDECYMVLLQI